MRKLRYVALGPLLAGEGSRAFLGLQVTNESKARPVVLVFTPDAANNDPALLERIRRETEHAATLEHPNIIRVLGFTKLDEGHARVVEFADGESVRRILQVTHVLPPRFAAKVAADAAMGVHYAHLAGNDDGAPLLHGDLRPETLMVSFAGVCKVSGYDALSVAPNDTDGNLVRGRRLHCSPEQVIGGRGAMVLQTDVYLLGLTLYECLVGKVPFESASDLDQAILAGLPPPIDDPHVPELLKGVVARSMAKKAPERYATPLEFKEAIEVAMGGKLPSSQEFATYLQAFFPQGEETRAARRREIDAGIADFARRQWEMSPSSKMPALSAEAIAAATGKAPTAAPAAPAPVPTAPARVQVSAPAPSTPTLPFPDRRAPARAQREDDDPAPAPRDPKKPRTQAIVVGSLGVAALALVWGLSHGTQENSRPRSERSSRADPAPPVADPVPPVVVVDSGAAGVAPAAQTPVQPTVAKVEEPPLAPPPPPPPPSEPARLELEVEPAVDVAIDGKPVGRSPIRQVLAPGRHVVALTDRKQGISTTRVVVVRAKGKTSEEITLGKGTLNLTAPEGAVVFLDGTRVGYAPIREVPIWEGNHRLVVKVGKAKWEESFYVRAHQPVSFNVHTE